MRYDLFEQPQSLLVQGLQPCTSLAIKYATAVEITYSTLTTFLLQSQKIEEDQLNTSELQKVVVEGTS